MLGFVSRDVGPIKGVREISPGLVAQSTDRDGSTFDHVQYSIAHMKAFKALGEALVRIEALEATIASLHPEKGV